MIDIQRVMGSYGSFDPLVDSLHAENITWLER